MQYDRPVRPSASLLGEYIVRILRFDGTCQFFLDHFLLGGSYMNLRCLLLVSLAFTVLMTAGSRGQDTADKPFPVPEGAPLIENTRGLISRIAFGSCGNQNKSQPILKHVIEQKPEVFCYLGDNIYGDSRTLAVLRAKYLKLAEKSEFQALRSAMPLIATWDDHDYGENDSGKEYVLREESKRLFLEFFREPEGTQRRKRPGIYTSYVFAGNERRVQIILLDTRTFRDQLAKNPRFGREKSWKNDYHPDPNPEKTLLGKAQWEWLEAELKQPADVRVIASSIQFAHEYNGYESWTNLPAEQAKLLDVLRRTKANGVVFISGDVHWGELSILNSDGLYPLYDITSSGLTETWPSIEPNRNRLGDAVRENNFGLIEIDWEQKDPALSLQLIDVKGTVRVKKVVKLSELQSK
jgi:alkaline phosphatase D